MTQGTYSPDVWRLLKIVTPTETYFRVFGGWIGGYTSGSAWRLNSGVTAIEILDDGYLFYGSSGSTYYCNAHYGRLDMYLNGVLEGIVQDKYNVSVSVVDEQDVLKELAINGVELIYGGE